MTDKHCEELAFPVLFPNGRFGYIAEKSVNLSPSKYFNARLSYYSSRFAMNPEYLFFAQFIIEQKIVSDSINIALSELHGQSLTASDLRSNVQKLKFQEQAYLFLRHVPGSPPYWQKVMYEVVATVKQFGIPTWFMTLSCADLRWPELFWIIGRTKSLNFTDAQVDTLSYNKKVIYAELKPFWCFFPIQWQSWPFQVSHLHSRTKDLTLRFFLANQHYINKHKIYKPTFTAVFALTTLF